MTTLFGQFGNNAGPATGATLTVANWTTSGYNFVYAPNTADSGTQASGANTGQPNEAPGQYNAANGYGNTYLWGPNNGSANGLTTSPAGGNFIAADPVYETDSIRQTITGLTIGKVYLVKFYWAAAQQQAFDGATTEFWTVSLGSESHTTSTYSLANHAFSGWMQGAFTFTATAVGSGSGTQSGTTATLSFLAGGTPAGLPPFVLLDGVELDVVPEFSSWMIFAGFGLVCLLVEGLRRHRCIARPDLLPGV
jgi:hypothetical protein